jgi:hypothetical protein
MTPIILPLSSSRDVARCPHCGEVLPDDGPVWPVILGSTGFVMLFMGLVWTIIMWIFPYEGKPTLVQVLASEWQSLVDLMRRAY